MAINGLRYAAGAYATTSDLASNAGLNLVAVSTFSAASSVSVNNCFSATYDNYKIIIVGTSSAGNSASFRLRASGSDITSANYASMGWYWGSSASGYDSGGSGSGLTQARFGVFGSTPSENIQVIDIASPALARRKVYTVLLGESTYIRSWTGSFESTTTADGISIYPASGTITGNLRIYGYQNS